MSYNDLTARVSFVKRKAEANTDITADPSEILPLKSNNSNQLSCMFKKDCSASAGTREETPGISCKNSDPIEPVSHDVESTGLLTLSSMSTKVVGELKPEAEPQTKGKQVTDMQEQSDIENAQLDRSMPAGEIGRKTMRLLSEYLRQPMVNAKDWQDMAEEMGFNYQREIQNFKLEPNPVERVITAWGTKRGSTVGALLDILEDIERDDVLRVLPPALAIDCRRWKRRLEEENEPLQVSEVSGNYQVQSKTEELRGITLGDHPSGPPETFDAYVCFADADYEFAHVLIKKLESPPHCFKLCFDQRDLVPGGSHAIVTAEIIQNRCKKMLVILSPEFLHSASCDFQTKFAVSLEPGARTKRIIPVVAKPCTAPSIIKHVTMCDFTRRDLHPWLWEKLSKAISLP